MTDAEFRFWSRVCIGDGCWVWCGPADHYGSFYMDGRRIGAHRAAWFLTFGQIPDGLMVCHRCDNRRCVRPSHLFLGTAAQNTRDMMEKGRWRRAYHARGEINGHARLTTADVVAIRGRAAAGESQRAIARSLGVSRFAVQSVVRGWTWRHVQQETGGK